MPTAYFTAEHYTESIPLFEKAAELAPTDVASVGNLADSYRQAKRYEKMQATYDQAIELAYKQLEVNPKDSGTLGFLALFYAKKGGTPKAREIIAGARSINSTSDQLMYDEAVIDALGRHDQEALQALGRALQNGYPLEDARKDPDLASVRALPGYKDVAKKYGG